MCLKSLKPINCPNCESPAKKNGSFIKKRSRVRIQRYYCHSCSMAFSKQSKNIFRRQHRPDLNEKIFLMVSSGMGIRRIATVLKTTPKTVQNKIKFLAVLCETFHKTHFINWKIKPKFQFDEMCSVERFQFNNLTIPVIVEKESYFIVASRSAHALSNNRYPSVRKKSNEERKSKIELQEFIILNTLNRVNEMKPHGKIVIDTDKKTQYPEYLTKVFGDRLVHNKYNAGVPEEAIKLFPINNTMACMRAEISKVRKRSWYSTKNNIWLNAHLAIYTVFYNYFRMKKYTSKTLPALVLVQQGEIKSNKVKKTFEHKTPAVKLGIFETPITFKYLMENYEPKYISAKHTEVAPLSHQLAGKKSA